MSAKPTSYRDRVGIFVQELLQQQPDLLLPELIEKVEKEHGIQLSPASMCRLRKELRLM